MSGASAPLPSRQTGMTRQARAGPGSAVRTQFLMTIASFIVGLSVILSYDWTNGGFRDDAGTTVLFGILVAAIIFIASRWGAATSTRSVANLRACPACGRAIPGDSLLCPYCGQRLS